MKKFKGVIFDVDGTLTSTNELIIAAFNHVTKKHLNKSLTKEEVFALFGPTEEQIIDDWFTENSDEVIKDYFNFYSENHSMAELYPGINTILDELKLKGVLLAIFTGKGKRSATITLEKLGVLKYFSFIVSGDDVKKQKPSGEGITNFLNEYNLQTDEVLMIGDSPSDVKASHEAGVKVALVLWDSYAKEKVLKLNSDYVFGTVEQLKVFLKENT